MFNPLYTTIPFKNGGRDFSGCDCWGLVQYVMYDTYKIDIPDYKISCVDFISINKKMRSEQGLSHWRRMKEPIEPCIILFKMHEDPRIINHAGLYIGNREFIHTLEAQGATITSLDHPFYRVKIEGFYEYSD